MNKDKKVGIEDTVLLFKFTLPPFDKYNFHPVNNLSTFSKMGFEIPPTLKEDPKCNPRGVIGKGPTLHPRISVRSIILGTSPIGVQFIFALLHFETRHYSKVVGKLFRRGLIEHDSIICK